MREKDLRSAVWQLEAFLELTVTRNILPCFVIQDILNIKVLNCLTYFVLTLYI